MFFFYQIYVGKTVFKIMISDSKYVVTLTPFKIKIIATFGSVKKNVNQLNQVLL